MFQHRVKFNSDSRIEIKWIKTMLGMQVAIEDTNVAPGRLRTFEHRNRYNRRARSNAADNRNKLVETNAMR